MANKFNKGDIIIKVKNDGGKIPVGTIVNYKQAGSLSDIIHIESLDGKDIPGIGLNELDVLKDSYELHTTATKQTTTAGTTINYPPIGSRWKHLQNNREIIITAHGIDFQGNADKSRVQFKYAHNNKLDSRNVKDFSNSAHMTPLDTTAPATSTYNIVIKKENNDNRTRCYACGALTRIVNTGFQNSIMRVCTKCKK